MDLKKYLRRWLGQLGYEIRKNPLGSFGVYDNLDEASAMLRRVQHRTFVSPEGLISLYNQVRYLERNQIDGAYVECGVWKGGAVGLMALVNMAQGFYRRDIHMFDAFTDICEPDALLDGKRAVQEVSGYMKGAEPTGVLRPLKGFYDKWGGTGTVEDCRHFLEYEIGYASEYLHHHVGWFQDTLPLDAVLVGRISLLRIDADWYASTKVCLEHLYHQVVPGGFVIIDDYGTYEGCRQATDEFLATLPGPVYLNYVDSGIRYLIKPTPSLRT